MLRLPKSTGAYPSITLCCFKFDSGEVGETRLAKIAKPADMTLEIFIQEANRVCKRDAGLDDSSVFACSHLIAHLDKIHLRSVFVEEIYLICEVNAKVAEKPEVLYKLHHMPTRMHPSEVPGAPLLFSRSLLQMQHFCTCS